MKEHAIPILIIGLVVAFATGFLVGANGREVVYPFPANYNPTQQASSDALKVSEENVQRCYTLITQQLERGCEKKEVAH